MTELSYEDLRDAHAFSLLGRLFRTVPAIHTVLRQLGADAAQLPLTDGRTPLEVWSEVCAGIADGKFRFTFTDLIRTALATFPANAELAALLGKAPGTGGGYVILCLQAAPTNANRIRLDVEHREIDAVAARYPALRVTTHPATRIKDIVRTLLRVQPQIVHFSGHGTAQGELVFENDGGKGVPVSSASLGEAFDAVGGIRCVLLNSCYNGAYARALLGSAEAVIGAIGPLRNDCAIVFASAFYRALGERRTFADAYRIAKSDLRIHGCASDLMRMVSAAGAAR